MTETYKIADKIIEVTSLYERVHRYCKDYVSGGEPDLSVNVTQADIDFERERSIRNAEAEGRRRPDPSDEYLEELAVYRKIAEKMPYYDTFLFHGSCIAVEGKAYLFAARSGIGKSTHTRLWRQLLGEKAVMVNDDKPLIKCSECGIIVYGTPYNGKHRLGSNIAVPLKAVCILERAEENSIRRTDKAEAYPMLLQQAYRPADGIALSKTLSLIDRMAESCELYRLGANMDISAAETAYNGMKG